MSGVAEVHPTATLQPSKLGLLAAWLPTQDWFLDDPADLERIAAFRFVDPDGEVGLDCMLIRSGWAVYHVPVTWRPTPLNEGEEIGTLEHSLLGTRYCYDAATDPVYVAELVRVIRDADTDADIVAAGEEEPKPRTIRVTGTGVDVGTMAQNRLLIVRLLDGTSPDGIARLVGQWEQDGRGRTDVLAVLS